MKRDIIDDLYSIVMKRYSKETPNVQLNNLQMEAIKRGYS